VTESGEAQTVTDDQQPADHEPHIRVVSGEPTDEELAAVILALTSISGGGGDAGPPDRNLWGHPVDKLRYPVFSWQQVTLLERTHMRR